MVPYGLNQKVEFKKNFGPILGELKLDEVTKIDEIDFVHKLHHIYKAIKIVNSDNILKNKNTIGFVGTPWTLLVYMVNQQSPKKFKNNFFDNDFLINRTLMLIEKFLKFILKIRLIVEQI